MDAFEVRTPDGSLFFEGSIDWVDAQPVGMDGDWMVYDHPSGGLILHVTGDGQARLGDDLVPLLPGVYVLTPDGLRKDGEPVWT